jgi:hypothetical protein
MKSILALASTLPLLASAIVITAPTNGTFATKGKDLTVSWTSVDTDPTTFGILLVNFVYVISSLRCFNPGDTFTNPSPLVATKLHPIGLQRSRF